MCGKHCQLFEIGVVRSMTHLVTNLNMFTFFNLPERTTPSISRWRRRRRDCSYLVQSLSVCCDVIWCTFDLIGNIISEISLHAAHLTKSWTGGVWYLGDFIKTYCWWFSAQPLPGNGWGCFFIPTMILSTVINEPVHLWDDSNRCFRSYTLLPPSQLDWNVFKCGI